MGIANFELRISNCEVGISNCEVGIAKWEFRISNFELRIAKIEDQMFSVNSDGQHGREKFEIRDSKFEIPNSLDYDCDFERYRDLGTGRIFLVAIRFTARNETRLSGGYRLVDALCA